LCLIVQTSNNSAERRRSATGFADQTQHFAAAYREVHAIDGMHSLTGDRAAKQCQQALSEVRVLFEALVNVAQFNDGGFLLRHEFSPAVGTKQRKLRLPSSATGGISTAHRSIARGHRGRNGQPSGLPASV